MTSTSPDYVSSALIRARWRLNISPKEADALLGLPPGTMRKAERDGVLSYQLAKAAYDKLGLELDSELVQAVTLAL